MSDAVLSWKKEFDDRIAAFSKSVNMPESKVREVFTQLGVDGNDERSLEIIENEDLLPISDLFKAFVDSKLAPIALVRLGNKFLKGNASKITTEDSTPTLSNSIQTLIASSRPLSQWSDEELLDKYDQSNMDVIEVLRKRSNGRHCIVHMDNGTINKEISLKLLRLSKRQVTSETFQVEGILVRVYRPGDFPPMLIDESPFNEGVPLVDGVCGKTNTNWNDISHEIRVLCRIQYFFIEQKQLGNSALKALWKNARNLETEKFRAEYPEAYLMYRDMVAKNKLPSLKVDSRGSNTTTKKDDSFGGVAISYSSNKNVDSNPVAWHRK